MPLGGPEEMRGYKGYGLALLVEILSGVLAGSAFGASVDQDSEHSASRTGHCFAAVRVDGFRPLEDFKRDMDALICQIKNAPKAVGQERIYIHGEKAYEKTERSQREGVPVLAEVVRGLIEEGRESGVLFDLETLGIIEETEI